MNLYPFQRRTASDIQKTPAIFETPFSVARRERERRCNVVDRDRNWVRVRVEAPGLRPESEYVFVFARTCDSHVGAGRSDVLPNPRVNLTKIAFSVRERPDACRGSVHKNGLLKQSCSRVQILSEQSMHPAQASEREGALCGQIGIKKEHHAAFCPVSTHCRIPRPPKRPSENRQARSSIFPQLQPHTA